MTSHTGRLYAVALALVVFFLAWAVTAAHPWAAAAPDPRLQALAAREARLQQESVRVKKIVARRWAVYRKRLKARNAAIAAAKARAALTAAQAPAASSSTSAPSAAPPVKVVTLPPLTITRTS